MGIEVEDICLDKEPDHVILYANGATHESNHEPIPDGHGALEPFEPLNGDTELPSSEESIEAKEYEVKICTTEIPVEANGLSQPEKSKEHQNVASSNMKTKLPEKNKSQDGQKSKSVSSVKHSSKQVSVGVKTKHTVPQPFALATEKRASSGSRTEPDLMNGVSKSSKANNVLRPNPTKQNQSHSTSRKPLQPKNKKHSDDDDTYSITSSTTQAIKSKRTIASAPTFRSTERAEKRKEFYSKLEEKHQALEAEKTQNEARHKEEMEAAIKQLRKSLTFKANPMPSFYNEGPPPKVELKKLPPTRARSPKLGRRKSCSNNTNPSTGGNENAHASISTNGKDQHIVPNSLYGTNVMEEMNEAIGSEANGVSADLWIGS